MARQTRGNIPEIKQQTVLTYQADCNDSTPFLLYGCVWVESKAKLLQC